MNTTKKLDVPSTAAASAVNRIPPEHDRVGDVQRHLRQVAADQRQPEAQRRPGVGAMGQGRGDGHARVVVTAPRTGKGRRRPAPFRRRPVRPKDAGRPHPADGRSGGDMLTLYGVYRSRASRPLWLLAEASISFRHVPVIQSYRVADPDAPGAPLHTASPAFRAVSPMGQIPVLTDGDLTLTESMAIVLHLAGRAGAIGPADAAEAAAMANWAFFAATAVEPHALAILQATDPGAASGAAARLIRPFARAEAHLSTAQWLVGGRFTAADIALAECVRYAQGDAALLSAHPALSNWLACCQARPAFAAMWAAREAEPA